MFVDVLIEYNKSSQLCSLLSVEQLFIFEVAVQYVLNMFLYDATPLIVLVAGARATTHIPSMKELERKLKLPTMKFKHTFKQININAIQYAHLI